MIVTFVIPNRDDPTKPPTIYTDCSGATVVPRVGETVYLGDPDIVPPWIVKWVRHTFRAGEPQKVEVRLIEPLMAYQQGLVQDVPLEAI